jgi:hypothetical protein
MARTTEAEPSAGSPAPMPRGVTRDGCFRTVNDALKRIQDDEPPNEEPRAMTVIRASQVDAVRDQRIERLVPLITPQELFDELPLDDDRVEVLLNGRAAARAL